MKKMYKKPIVEAVEVKAASLLLAGSQGTDTGIGGGNNTDEIGGPITGD